MPQKKQQDKQEQNRVLDESMHRALTKVQSEMPDVKPVTLSPSSSSLLSGFMMPRATLATTNPFTGNITYSPEANYGVGDSEMEQTMAHELTHSRQAQNTPWYRTLLDAYKPDAKVPQEITPGSTLDNPYLWRPNEMEAFQTERNRAMNQGLDTADPVTGARDIMLPKDKKKGIDTTPSFMRK